MSTHTTHRHTHLCTHTTFHLSFRVSTIIGGAFNKQNSINKHSIVNNVVVNIALTSKINSLVACSSNTADNPGTLSSSLPPSFHLSKWCLRNIWSWLGSPADFLSMANGPSQVDGDHGEQSVCAISNICCLSSCFSRFEQQHSETSSVTNRFNCQRCRWQFKGHSHSIQCWFTIAWMKHDWCTK